MKNFLAKVRYSNQILILTILSTAVALIWIGLRIYRTHNEILRHSDNITILTKYSGDIRHIDEIITNSIHLVAFTGDLKWAEKYNYYVESLNKAIKKVILLEFDAGVQIQMLKVDSANIKLEILERQIIEFVKNGDLIAAQNLISGQEYANEKAHYKDGLNKFLEILDLKSDEWTKLIKRNTIRNYTVFFIMLAFLLILWIPLIRLLISSRKELIFKNQLLVEEMRKRALIDEKFRSVFENSPLGKSITGIDGSIVSNNAFAKMLGYSINEFQTKKWQEITHPDDIKSSSNVVESLLKGDRLTERFEKRYLHKNGSVVITDVSVTLQKDKQGNPLFFITTIIDITDRRRIENELKESQQLFETLTKVSPVGIFRTRTDGYTTYVNPKWMELSGLTFEEAIGNGWIKAVHPDDKEKLQNSWKLSLDKGKESKAEYRFIKPDGKIIWVLGDAAPEIIDQKVQGYIGTITDISERKKMDLMLKEKNEEYLSINKKLIQTNEELLLAKEKAEEGNRLKTAFLENMSHEIRTPMNGIVGFAKLLKKQNLEPDQQKYYAEIIVNSSNQLLGIVNDILDMSKIETEQLELYVEEIELFDFMKDIFSFFEMQAKLKGLHLNLINKTTKEKPVIKTDTSKLKQIINNLISNALKFTDQGQIDFGYSIKGNQLEFFVKDTGIGIPKKYQNDIFDRFQKVDGHKTRLYNGTGLGLAICKGLVNKMGGEIWVESEVNKGAQFYFTLPFQNINKSIEQKFKEVQLLHDFNNVTVLIVEDEQFSLNYLEEVLTDLNIDYVHAKDGKQAIEVFRNKPEINLILMDIRLPIIDGYEVTREIKKINPKIPIIAQTANALSHDREKALEAGCDDYISKPIDEKHLIQLLDKYLKYDQDLNYQIRK